MDDVYHLALSCLQGEPMQSAAETLVGLGAPALQLTPGCTPTPAFAAYVGWLGVPVRTHHGFAWTAARRPVWAGDELVGTAHSVHPPDRVDDLDAWLAQRAHDRTVVEVMYPGCVLGTGVELRAAMGAGVALAVDVSHLHIQRTAGVLDDAALAALLTYDRVAEVHVSANDGRTDRHGHVTMDTFGLAWAAERASEGTPLVCESYLQHATEDDRRRLVDVLETRFGGA